MDKQSPEQAGYAACEAAKLPIIPGCHAQEAVEAARQYLMHKHINEFRAFIKGFDRRTHEEYSTYCQEVK